jgi:hypothetical protein
VVAPISVTVPFSTQGSSASCCALLKRCTSSTKRIVRRPARCCSCASATASRMSLTPPSTALSEVKRARVVLAITRARVVLPVPGGP